MINYRLSTSSGSCFKIEATENKFWRGNVFVCRSGGAWNVNEINVHEAFRRKGIGRRLYEFAAKESCKRGEPRWAAIAFRSLSLPAHDRRHTEPSRAHRDARTAYVPGSGMPPSRHAGQSPERAPIEHSNGQH